MTGARIAAWAGYVAAATFLAAFLLLPVGVILHQGLDRTLLYEALAHPVYRAGLVNSLGIAVVVTAIALALAVPLAWLGARVRFRGQAIAESLLLAPLILPSFVGAIGVFQIFGQYGVINAALARLGLCAIDAAPDWLGDHRFALVCVVEALGLFPILYLNTAANLARLDGSLIEAAAGLGAGPWTRLRRIVLPLITPGLFAGGIIVFVGAFTELGTPLVLGYQRALPVQIFAGLNEVSSNRLPFAQVVIMLTVATGLYLGARLLVLRRIDAGAAKGGAQVPPRRLTGWRAALAWLPFALVIAMAVAPHLAVLLTAVAGEWYRSVLPSGWTAQHYRDALGHEQVVPAIVNSLRYAGAASVLGVVLGVFIAWVGTRWKPPGWRALDAVAMLPLAVPGVIMAFGYLGLANLPGWKRWLDPVENPTLILIIAYGVRRLPQVVRAAAAGFAQAPVVFEEAAASLGAGPFTRLRRITLPLIAGAIGAGAMLVFSSSMLEVSDSLVLAQKREFYPVTKVIYDLLAILGPGPAIACAFATWAMVFLATALAATAALRGTDIPSLFRDQK